MSGGPQIVQGSGFLIRAEKLDLEIRLVDLTVLHLHEQIIPELLKKIQRSLSREGVMRDPVIVDCASLVVLDGVHRVAALRKMGCLRALACMVDYANPAIEVKAWYRTVNRRDSPSRLEAIIRGLGLSYERRAIDIRNPPSGTGLSVIDQSGTALRIDKESSLRDSFSSLELIERKAKASGLRFEYETEDDAMEKLLRRKVGAVISLPQASKSFIAEVGSRDDLLPHKVTRHIIPARPLGVEIPVDVLRDSRLSLTQANEELERRLRSRSVKRMPQGSVVAGRRYDEEIYMFS